MVHPGSSLPVLGLFLLLVAPPGVWLLQNNAVEKQPVVGSMEEEVHYLKLALLDRLQAMSYKLEWALGAAGNPPLNASRFLQLMGDMKGRLISIEDSVANGRCDPVVVTRPPVTCPQCPACPVVTCPACPQVQTTTTPRPPPPRNRRRRRFFRRIG